MEAQRLINLTRKQILVTHLFAPKSILGRMKGLLGRKHLPDDQGIWLAPCNWVHSLFMNFAIDLIFVDRNLQVVRTISHFKPWRFSPMVLGAAAVIEINGGRLQSLRIEPGDKLAIEGSPTHG